MRTKRHFIALLMPAPFPGGFPAQHRCRHEIARLTFLYSTMNVTK